MPSAATPRPARLAGVRVKRVLAAVYMIAGVCAGLAGIIFAARVISAQPTAGTGYELDAIAAVVLGGTSLAGGRGRIIGTPDWVDYSWRTQHRPDSAERALFHPAID
ncbi:ribose ABC transport system [Klebsiella michiganensis]|uniref:Ribose ABC transport system n=1 Tax=Klebsiella michiganensis TaxID=1134687 RepID=A0A7H4MZ14_9ENTR|nr:ribose ABC transport system [Klebsiella michiganensis]